MASGETFEIAVENGTVRGALHRPLSASSETPAPAVLLCRGVYIPADDAGGLFDQLSHELVESGLAVLRFDHRCANMILDDFDAHNAVHDIEDAMAALRWLLRQNDIDRARVGVVGFSLGAIAATAVCNNMPSVARLCLLNAMTAASVAPCIAAGIGSHGSNGNGAQKEAVQLPAAYAASLGGIDSPREAAAHDRPTLVLHGASDRFVPPKVSLEYVRVLMDAKRRVEHVLVARGDHTFSASATRSACVERACDFFKALLSERAAEPATSGT
jgi:dipeptidyl aminopeptidase/acylaminoacyl peptidase